MLEPCYPIANEELICPAAMGKDKIHSPKLVKMTIKMSMGNWLRTAWDRVGNSVSACICAMYTLTMWPTSINQTCACHTQPAGGISDRSLPAVPKRFHPRPNGSDTFARKFGPSVSNKAK